MWIEAKHLSNNSGSNRKKTGATEFGPLFRRALMRWYRNHGRHLPWRETRDPYAILVSEIMLQQTTVATVLRSYENWLTRFPDFKSLADADESDVLHAWQGLGYYSRARNLHTIAKIVSTRYRGRLPRPIEELTRFPGIGRYTANAIASFAYDQAVPVVEANTARVISRLFNLTKPIDTASGRNQLWTKANQLLPSRSGSNHNSALMDLGALICIARQPRCHCCPVRRFCRARNPGNLPVKKQRPALVHISEKHIFNFERGRVLLEKSRRRWRGMWMLPTLTMAPAKSGPLHVSEFPFTHHRVTLIVYAGKKELPVEPGRRELFSATDLTRIPIPSPHRRVLTELMAARSQKLCSSFSTA